MDERYERIVEQFERSMENVGGSLEEYLEALQYAKSQIQTMIDAAREDIEAQQGE